MATIHLRIVGLYFNAPVTIDDARIAAGISIKDVIDAYVAAHPLNTPRGLAYTIKLDPSEPGADPFETLLSFSHNYDGRYDFFGDGNDMESGDGPTLSGSTREAGVYMLQENTIPGVTSGALVWQYYLQGKDADGGFVPKSKTPVSRGFKSFAAVPEDPARRVADGDTIIWRLVALLFAPSVPGKAPRVVQKSLVVRGEGGEVPLRK